MTNLPNDVYLEIGRFSGLAEVSALRGVSVEIKSLLHNSWLRKLAWRVNALWKIFLLRKRLASARGSGTTLISVVIPPGDSVNRWIDLVNSEVNTHCELGRRAGRLSVFSNFNSVMNILCQYKNGIPVNGLLIYCGTIWTPEGKEKKINISTTPPVPIQSSLYLHDNKFHCEVLSQMLDTFHFHSLQKYLETESIALFQNYLPDERKIIETLDCLHALQSLRPITHVLISEDCKIQKFEISICGTEMTLFSETESGLQAFMSPAEWEIMEVKSRDSLVEYLLENYLARNEWDLTVLFSGTGLFNDACELALVLQ